ncbi:MAG TPA: SDR family oxidoreductase [Tepidiformaceae bacterium]|nr:SDR family oxidoreductase [Tepidiformaceae bacterium]
MTKLTGQVALVAGGTRGAGRGIAIALGELGATVYVTGRSSRTAGRSPMDRPETIEETAELVTVAGGVGIPVRTDHSDHASVAALAARVKDEQAGRLDILVNDVWGGDPMVDWEHPFWEQDLATGIGLLRQALETHIITSHHLVPLMVARGSGLVVEITDGVEAHYRGSFYYDLAKAGVIRLAVAQAGDLKKHGVTAVAVTPGFLRSEAMLDHFGVTEANWRDGVAKDKDFIASETPLFVGRAVASLATDPDRARFTGQALSSWGLSDEYPFVDRDGARPHWGRHYATAYPNGFFADD